MVIWMIVAFLFILGPLLFVHELGHFWVAKHRGIPVEEFGFGLGPKLVTLFRRDGTDYTIRAIPFAAFVRMAGEEQAGVASGLLEAPRRSKLAVFAAGPGMNIVAAIFLLWVAYLFGPPAFTRIAIEAVNPNAPGEKSGLQPDDVILAIDGQELSSTSDLAEYSSAHLGEPVVLLVQRDGEEMNIPLTPRREGEYDPQIEGPIGITMRVETGPPDPQNLFKAGVSAATDFGGQIEMIASFPRMLVNAVRVSSEKAGTGETIAPEEDIRNFRPLGIYGILQLIAFTLQTGVTEGYWYYIFQTAALISLALGVTNLLPFPAIDGGRIMFIALDWIYEKLFRRKINPEKEIVFHAVGLMVLLFLMILITWQDIVNPLIQFPTSTPIP